MTLSNAGTALNAHFHSAYRSCVEGLVLAGGTISGIRLAEERRQGQVLESESPELAPFSAYGYCGEVGALLMLPTPLRHLPSPPDGSHMMD